MSATVKMNAIDHLSKLAELLKEVRTRQVAISSNQELLAIVDRCEELLEVEIEDDGLSDKAIKTTRQCSAYVIRRVLESLLPDEEHDIAGYIKKVEEFLNSDPESRTQGFKLTF